MSHIRTAYFKCVAVEKRLKTTELKERMYSNNLSSATNTEAEASVFVILVILCL